MLRKEQQDLLTTLTATQASAAKAKEEFSIQIRSLQNDCSQKIAEAKAHAEEVAARFQKDNAAAAKAKSEGEAFRRKQQELLKKEREKIDQLAEQKISNTKSLLTTEKEKEVKQIKAEYKKQGTKLKKKYETKYAAKEIWHVEVFSFCVLWLIIQAISSNYFRSEVKSLFQEIREYIVTILELIQSWSESAAGITNEISNHHISSVFYWIILIIVGILLFIFFLGLPLIGILGGSILYLLSNKFDKLNRWIMIGSGILFICLASELFYRPPINLLLFWFLIQIMVPILRFLIIPLIRSGIERYQNMDYYEIQRFRGNIIIAVTIIGTVILVLWLIPRIFN